MLKKISALVLIVIFSLNVSFSSLAEGNLISAAGSAVEVNVALNKAVTTSSNKGGNAGANAVDGNTGTRWESEFSDPQWISIDLGEEKSISSLRLVWEGAAGKDYVIQTSVDNAIWTDAYQKAGGTGGTERIVLDAPVTARYVRLNGTARTTPYGYSLWEFEVYSPVESVGKVETPVISPEGGTYTVAQDVSITCATEGATIRYTTDGTTPSLDNGKTYTGAIKVESSMTLQAIGIKSGYEASTVASSTFTMNIPVKVNIALNKNASASSYVGGNAAQRAFDGNTGSRWESQSSDPQWVSVDLGAVYSVKGVKLTWEGAAGKDYKIQVSVDNVNWVDAYIKIGGKGGVEEIAFDAPVEGQYVRMYGTVRLTGYGYSLWEFAVYGDEVISNKVAKPIMTPGAGTYNAPQLVSLTTSTSGATILYTLDGTVPSLQNGWVYTGPFMVWFHANIHAIAIKDGMENSDELTTAMTIERQNLALGKTATATSGEASAALAFDGNLGTRWESAFSDPQSLTVDLGNYYEIDSIGLLWETAAAKAYKIQVSMDNQDWVDVYTQANGVGGTQLIAFAGAVKGRYVKMSGTARTTGYGYSLWEMRVFGEGPVDVPLTKVATPVVTPGTGIYNKNQTVTFTAEEGATIIYTTDGTTPTRNNGTTYTAPFIVTSTKVVKAFAIKDNRGDSDVATSVITIEKATLSAPTGLAVTATTSKSVRLTWNAVTGAQGYNLYRSYQADGVYTKVNIALVKTTNFNQLNLDTATYYYKVTAVMAAGESKKSAAVVATTALDFGANVKIFDPSMDTATMQATIDGIYNQMDDNQFGSERYALMFKPGAYDLDVAVGFYTSVYGLGRVPDDVTISGSVRAEADWMGGNATCNFWRSAENYSVVPTYSASPVAPAGTETWAASQAAPMRRVHVKGNLSLWDPNPSNYDGSWSSGGFLVDSKVDGQISSGSQQQYLTRNTEMNAWSGANFSMVFVGDEGAPEEQWPNPSYTVVEKTPLVREKPFLYWDGADYQVFVPGAREMAQGVSWENGMGEGTSMPLAAFVIAHPGISTAKSLNEALNQGKSIIFTPGIYALTEPLKVVHPDTVLLGLGLATLIPVNGTAAMKVADVDGVKIAGLLFDAGATNSPVLLEVGPSGSSAGHKANPTTLSDLFFRVGGAALGKADVSLVVNSDDVIGDHFWVWRADHSYGVGWYMNTTKNGLIVNGDDVTIYGLFVEHYHEYQTLWNGNGGEVYFYQSETPYDVPNQTSWNDGVRNGYASYVVADSVTSHKLYGAGVYSFFRDADVKLTSGILVPDRPEVVVYHAVSIFLSGKGEITHIVNEAGDTVKAGTMKTTLAVYNNMVAQPVVTPGSGTYGAPPTVSIATTTAGATIRYTTDGSMPSVTNGIVYAGAFEVTANSTIKAIAYKEGMNPSGVVTAVIKINTAFASDLALNKVSKSSSGISRLAFDGDLNTRWASDWSDNQWIMVDLGIEKTITNVKISWETAAGKDYKIQVSNDGTTWSDAYTRTGGTGGIEEITFDTPATGRYLRLIGTARTTQWGYSIWEFEVFGN